MSDEPRSDTHDDFIRRLIEAAEAVHPSEVAGGFDAHAAAGRRPRPQQNLPAPPSQPMRLQLRVDLVDAEPPIWRRLSIPSDLTLDRVHDVLQAAFGWTNSHLHRFAPTDDRYGDSPIITHFDLAEGATGTLEETVRLDQLVRQRGNACFYTYDFGDDWEHRIVVEEATPLDSDDRDIRCLDGGRLGPPEDAGGVSWYNHLREVAADRQHPEFADLHDQIRYHNLDRSPDVFDLDAANRAIARTVAAPDALARLAEEDSPIGRLVRACQPELALFLAGYLAAARREPPAEPTEAEALRATAAIRTFLAEVPADGIALTPAGNLPMAHVGRMMAALDPDRHWIGTSNREDHARPLLHLREAVTAAGLVRKQRGRLSLTAAGAKLKDNPIGLWRHLAARMPLERTESGSELGLLLLTVVAAGEASDRQKLHQTMDLLALMVGWQFESHPFLGTGVLISVAQMSDLLKWAGSGELVEKWMAPVELGVERTGLHTPAARALARAALGPWGSGSASSDERRTT